MNLFIWLLGGFGVLVGLLTVVCSAWLVLTDTDDEDEGAL